MAVAELPNISPALEQFLAAEDDDDGGDELPPEQGADLSLGELDITSDNISLQGAFPLPAT